MSFSAPELFKVCLGVHKSAWPQTVLRAKSRALSKTMGKIEEQCCPTSKNKKCCKCLPGNHKLNPEYNNRVFLKSLELFA